MSDYVDFWKQMDDRAARAQALLDATKSEIESLVALNGKWKFVGVRGGGTKWVARHRMHGEVIELSAPSLLLRIKEIISTDQARREARR